MADVTMPQLGETVTEGTITKWFKNVGDKVDADEPLFEVSTDKVDSEVPAPAAGYLAEIVVQEGETVDVGVKLAVITSDAPATASAAESGSDDGGGDGQAAPEAQEAQKESEQAAERPEVEQESARPQGAEAEAELARAQRQPEGDGDADAGSRPDAPKDAATPAAAQSGAARPAPSDRDGGEAGGKVLSPVVRRLIRSAHRDHTGACRHRSGSA